MQLQPSFSFSSETVPVTVLAPCPDMALPPEAQRWNDICGGPLGKVLHCGATRLRHLYARRKDPFWRENFEAACRCILASDFCRGVNDRRWKASFDWLVERPDAVSKLMEGRYDNRGPAPQGPARRGNF